MLEQCARKYYYEYYGASKRLAKIGSAQQPALARLKALQNRYEFAGQIMHRAIATFFRKRQERKAWSIDFLRKWIDHAFDEAVSRSSSHCSRGGAALDAISLHEYYYCFDDASELYRAMRERVQEAFTIFAETACYQEAREYGTLGDAMIEKRFKRLSCLPCGVEGQIDLCYLNGQRITIVDWKMGSSTARDDDSLQLLTYSLWALEHYTCQPDSISIYKAFLGSGDLVPFSLGDEELRLSRIRIIQDAERMSCIHQYGRQGLVEAFTRCEQPRICSLCSYREVCGNGRNGRDD